MAVVKMFLKKINLLVSYLYLIGAVFQKIWKKITVIHTSITQNDNEWSFENQADFEDFLDKNIFDGVLHFCVHVSIKSIRCKDFDADRFINYLKYKAGDNLLLIPIFTMQTTQYKQLQSKNVQFSNKLISTGYISKLVFNDQDFKIAYHPTHSYAILKNVSSAKISTENYNGITSEGSPLKFLHDLNGTIINFGVGLNQTTFMHCVEEPGINFPFNTLAKPISGFMNVDQILPKRTFCIRSLKPFLHYLRDCDNVREVLIDKGVLKELNKGKVRFQKIDMQSLRVTLEKLALEGKTIYGKFLPVKEINNE